MKDTVISFTQEQLEHERRKWMNAGADNVYRGIHRCLKRFSKVYRDGGLTAEADVLNTFWTVVREYRARTSKTKGGTGRI